MVRRRLTGTIVAYAIVLGSCAKTIVIPHEDLTADRPPELAAPAFTPEGLKVSAYTTRDSRRHAFVGTVRVEGDTVIFERPAGDRMQPSGSNTRLVAIADLASVDLAHPTNSTKRFMIGAAILIAIAAVLITRYGLISGGL